MSIVTLFVTCIACHSLTELWSLLNFIMPKIFDSLDHFQAWFDFEDELVESTAAVDEYTPMGKRERNTLYCVVLYCHLVYCIVL